MQQPMQTQMQMGQPQETQQFQGQQPQTVMVVQQPMQTQPQQVFVVQQQPQQQGAGATTTGATQYASVLECIRVEYYKEPQACPIGTARVWALICWSLILVSIIALLIVCIVWIGAAVACIAVDPGDEDTDTVNTVTDVVCGVLMALGIGVGIAACVEMCCISMIIHGIRNFNSCMCIFGCVWAGLGFLSSFAYVGGYAYYSVPAMVLWGLALVFTALHTHYINQARAVWTGQSRR